MRFSVRSRNLRLLSAAVLPLVLLTACGDDSAQDGGSSGSSKSTSATPLTVAKSKVASISDASVSTSNPKKPTLKVSKTPFRVNETTTKVNKAGTGKKIGNKDITYVSYVAVNGTSGKTIESTFGKPNAAFNLGNPGTFPGLVKALKGKKVGTEMTVAVPPSEGFGGQGNKKVGVTSKDTLIFYVKVNDSMPILKEVKGTEKQAPAGKGFPKATVPKGVSKQAKITIPKTEKKPSKTISHDLITGQGPKLVEGQTILVSYTGQIWGGKVFDATAKAQGKQPATFQLTTGGQQGVIPGYVKGLVGHKVGSRVLIVMPPSDGYGKKGNKQAGIKGTDSLVFVVDVLAAI